MAGSRFDQIILLMAMLLSFWAFTQFDNLAGQHNIASTSNTYTLMALITLVVSLAGAGIFQFTGIKSTGSRLLLMAAVGGLIGFLSTSQGKTILAPLLPAAIDSTLSAVFILFLAPFVEEYFFRGFLFPTITNLTGNRGLPSVLAGAAISSALFVVWHLVAYTNTPDAFIPLFIFAMVQCGLVHFTKELAPAIGSHFILNLITRGQP